jgi:transcriptional regulator with XRE-family HTH domain
VSRFSQYVRAELERQGITISELERRTEIPDSTLSRILSSGVEEPKPSQIARIAKALDLKFWLLMQRAGYTTETPDDPGDETRRLAAVLDAHPTLREIMSRAERMTAEEQDAVLTYMIVLEQRRPQNRRASRRKKSPAAPEDK